MPTLAAMSPMSSIAIVTCLPACSLLWLLCLPVVYFDYLQSTKATRSVLQLAVVYYDYLQSIMVTCSLLWLSTIYYGYLQSTMGTCSLLWLPAVYYGCLYVVYYGYTYIASLQCYLVFCTQLIYYNSLCAV